MNDSEKYWLSFKCIAMSDSQANYYCALGNIIAKTQTMFQAKAVLGKLDQLYHFSRFNMLVLIYIFSDSDLLHSVRQSLGPFISVQMTQFYSFE